MKNRNYYLQRLKIFLKLSGVYYNRFKRGMTLENLLSQLDNEIFIYEYYKALNDLEHAEYNGFIEKDEDIEENFFALAKAYCDFTKTNESTNEMINEYILKMKNR